MRLDIVTIIRVFVAALLAALFLAFIGCKTIDCIPETIVRDSIRTEYRIDSVYRFERDSIFIKEKADTIWVEKYITRYKDVLQVRIDTIYQDNSEVIVKEIEVEKPIAGITKWFAWIGVAFVAFYLVKIGLWVYRKFALKV